MHDRLGRDIKITIRRITTVRSVLAAIAGYFAMFMIIFALCTGGYLLLGADSAFDTGTYDVSITWIIASTVCVIIASVIAGYLTKLVGGSMTGVKILAGMVLVLGILIAIIFEVTPRSVGARTADVPNMEAMAKARNPFWVSLMAPLIGVVGIMIGGGLRKRG